MNFTLGYFHMHQEMKATTQTSSEGEISVNEAFYFIVTIHWDSC